MPKMIFQKMLVGVLFVATVAAVTPAAHAATPITANALSARILAVPGALSPSGSESALASAITAIVSDSGAVCTVAKKALADAALNPNLSVAMLQAIGATSKALGECADLRAINSFGGGSAAFGSLGAGGGGGGGGSDYSR